MNSKSKIQQFADGSIVLLCSNLAIKTANFFLLPLYTKYLTPEHLGISDTITSFTAFLYPLLVLAFDSAFSAFYYDTVNDNTYTLRLLSTVEITMFITSIPAIMLIFLSDSMSQVLFHNTGYTFAIKIALLSVVLNLWYTPLSIQIRMENRMKILGGISVITSVAMLFLNILFVSLFKLNYLALILGTFMAQMISLGLYMHFTVPKIRIYFWDRRLFFKMLRYALPMVPMLISSWILSLSDRYILLYFKGEAAVGLYGIASRFVTVLNVITNSISTAYVSYAFSSVQDKDSRKNASKILNSIFVLILIICFTISIFSKEIVLLMTNSMYLDSYIVVAPLMLGQVCYCIATIVGYGIAFAKKSSYFFIATFSGMIANVGLNLMFIPQYGYFAAALTTFLGYFLMMFVTYYLAQKVYPCPYRIKVMSILIVSMLIICICLIHYGLIVRGLIWLAGMITVYVSFQSTIKMTLRFQLQYFKNNICRRKG